MNKAALLARIDSVIAKGKATLASANTIEDSLPRGYHPENSWVKADVAAAFRTAGISMLHSLFDAEHRIYKDFDAGTYNNRTLGSYRAPVALVETVREELEHGWLENTRALIAADIFTNILEMAEYLLSEGYKDAAAVLVGGSLEGHLKGIAPRHGVDIHLVDSSGAQRPKKAEQLNQELHKSDAYALGDQKQITAWLNLRNHAAHSEYDQYTADQVELMLMGVLNFIVRVPS